MTTETSTTRRCIGSSRFGIEPHEAPADEFPVQPSQKDGLGRMCKLHRRAYTNALRKAAVARKAAETATGGPAAQVVEPEVVLDTQPETGADPGSTRARRSRRARATVEPETQLAEAAAG